jgi:hypothetical protein
MTTMCRPCWRCGPSRPAGRGDVETMQTVIVVGLALFIALFLFKHGWIDEEDEA